MKKLNFVVSDKWVFTPFLGKLYSESGENILQKCTWQQIFGVNCHVNKKSDTPILNF